nr:glycoside hydrolase family 5 protein [Bacilli bacterium]
FELLDIYQENFFQDEDFDNVASLGLNCLRLPMSYLDVFDLDFDLMRSDSPDPTAVMNMKRTLRKDHLKKIDQFIYEAERRGIYVILDLHGAFGSQNGNDHSIDSRQHDWLWRQDELGEAFRDLTLDLWAVLADRYKSFKNVAGYDLLNEPAGDANDEGCVTSTTGKLQWDYFDALYKEIRAIDPNHLIIMESCWGAEDMPSPILYGWENVMYEFHHYDSVTDDGQCYSSHNRRVQNLLNANFGVPLYMGEFCPHCSYEGWTGILDLFNQNHISWTTWTYRVRGFSEWGLYHIRTDNEGDPSVPVSEIPAIARGNDSFEEIERKWGRDQRKGFCKNEELCKVVEKAAKAEISFE